MASVVRRRSGRKAVSGGEWAGDVDSFGGGGVDGRDDEAFLLLVSEEAVFSGVGVEAADGELRGAVADAGEGVRGEFDDIEDAVD